MYNANTENDKISTFSELTNLLENFDLAKNRPLIFAGDFNLFLDRSLETKGGGPYLKKNFSVKYFTLNRNQIYVIFGESEILKQNNILLGNNISLVLFKDA